MRSDARLNLERVLAAAKAAFAEHGAAASVEEIARRAGVGVGTLYRRFGSRAGLVEAVYDATLSQVADEGAALAGLPDAWEALVRWSQAYVDLLATKQTLLSELAPLLERRTDRKQADRRRADATFAAFLTRAQEAGQARPDVEPADLVGLLNATMRAGPAGARMLAVVLDGMRVMRDG